MPLPPDERAVIIQEVLDGLSIQMTIEYPAYGSSPPQLRVVLIHGNRELSSDSLYLSELQPD